MEKTTIECGTYKTYEVQIKPKYGATAIEIPDPCIVTIAPLSPSASNVFQGMVFEGHPVSFEDYIDAYPEYVSRCSVQREDESSVVLQIRIGSHFSREQGYDLIAKKLHKRQRHCRGM